MNTMTHASALCTVDGEPVALRDVAIEAVLQDLLAEVTVAQTYRNGEARPIEAVYTFPPAVGRRTARPARRDRRSASRRPGRRTEGRRGPL